MRRQQSDFQDQDRSALLSPTSNHRQYQRLKYYSALRTGYKHLTAEGNEPINNAGSFLAMPDEVIEIEQFIFQNPFLPRAKKGEKQSSIIIIFSCWKTMLGTAVVTLPWAYQESGLALGMIITVVSFVVSFYTCKLIVVSTGDDPEYQDTLKKYYGKPGYYAALIFPSILIIGALITYFSLMAQALYPICVAIYSWTSGDTELTNYTMDPRFDQFSTSYTSIIIFFILVPVINMKDLKIFMRFGSFGVIFVVYLLAFIIVVGIFSLTDTEYTIGNAE